MNTLPASVYRLKRAALVLFISIIAGASTTAQAQSLTIGSVQACAAPEVLVPVTGADLLNIGSITLFITFDSTCLVYNSVVNIDPQLNDIVYAFNTNPFQLAIVWSSVVPANLNQKKLFDIRFSFTGAACPVTFKSNCEVTDINLVILSVTYIDGSVSSGVPEITLQPSDTTVKPWDTAIFRTVAENAFSYLWKESKDNGQSWSDLSDNDIYKGTLTNRLVVQQVPPSYNSFRYSCTLNAAICPASTQGAILSVDSLAAVPGFTGTGDFALQIRPNPVTDFAFIEYNLTEEGTVNLEILDICGNVVARPFVEAQKKGLHSIRFDATGLPYGLYFCRLVIKNELTGHSACKKMIKQNN